MAWKTKVKCFLPQFLSSYTVPKVTIKPACPRQKFYCNYILQWSEVTCKGLPVLCSIHRIHKNGGSTEEVCPGWVIGNMESRHIRLLNNMASVGGSVDSVISSDTMSSVSLSENDIPGSSLDGRNPWTNIHSVLKCLALAHPPFLWIRCMKILTYHPSAPSDQSQSKQELNRQSSTRTWFLHLWTVHNNPRKFCTEIKEDTLQLAFKIPGPLDNQIVKDNQMILIVVT